MKLLGVDYGRRRIGLSISDESGIAVRPLHLIDRNKDPSPHETIARLVNSEMAEGIVFGLPLDIDDRETEMSREVKAFSETVREKLPPKFLLDFTDESFSSVHAHEQMLGFKKKKARSKKGAADLYAACSILRSYFEEHGELTR